MSADTGDTPWFYHTSKESHPAIKVDPMPKLTIIYRPTTDWYWRNNIDINRKYKISGMVSDATFSRYSGLPWRIDAEKNREIDFDRLAHVSSKIEIQISLWTSVNREATVMVDVSPLRDSDRGFHPSKVHDNILQLLGEVDALPGCFTCHNPSALHEPLQHAILSLTKTISDWMGSGDLSGYILTAGNDIASILTPYARLISSVDLDYQHADASGARNEISGTGPWKWNPSSHIREESVRLAALITQLTLAESGGIYQNDIRRLAEAKTLTDAGVDARFLKEVGLSKNQPTEREYLLSGEIEQVYAHPGEPVAAVSMMKEFLDFLDSVNTCPDESVASLVLSSLTLVEYASLLNETGGVAFSRYLVLEFMQDIKIRERTMRHIPIRYFNFSHGKQNARSHLDVASEYWMSRHKQPMESAPDDALPLAIRYFSEFDVERTAIERGLTGGRVAFYDEEMVKKSMRRLEHDEKLKAREYSHKLKSYLDSLTERGRFRYLAPPVGDLSRVAEKFPNFYEVCEAIDRQIKLARIGNSGAITMHPILLAGDPGIGKTRFVAEVARQIGISFHEVSMSSMTAGWLLSGMDLSWSNSRPGKIAEMLIEGDEANPILFLDEIDKGSGDPRNNAYGPLHQLLEKHTAATFMDEALRVRMNASHIIWFASANDLSAIPAPILDRFDVFRIPTLTRDQSFVVARNIYHEIITTAGLSGVFAPHLSDEAIGRISSENARSMTRMIRSACAAAAARGGSVIAIEPSDFIPPSGRQKMGF